MATPGVLRKPKPDIQINLLDGHQGGIKYRIVFFTSHEVRRSGACSAVHQQVIETLQWADIKFSIPISGYVTVEQENSYVELPDVNSTLQQIALFKRLPSAGLEALAKQITVELFQAENTLMEVGAEGDSMFVLVEGTVSVSIPLNPENKAELTQVATLKSGAVFGEMSLLTGAPRTATITAESECLTYRIDKDTMKTVFAQYPELIRLLSETLAERQMKNEKTRHQHAQEAQEQETTLVARFMEQIKLFFG